MRVKVKRILAFMLALVMTLTLAMPTQVYAEEAGDPADTQNSSTGGYFDPGATYAMVVDGNKAASIETAGWGTPMKLEGSYQKSNDVDEVSSKATLFQIVEEPDESITLSENEVRVKISCTVNSEKYLLRSVSPTDAAKWPFADNEGDGAHGRDDNKCRYIIAWTSEDEAIIRSVEGYYIKWNSNEDRTFLTENKDEALTFKFIKNPTVNASLGGGTTEPENPGGGDSGNVGGSTEGDFTIEHVKSHKLIKTYAPSEQRVLITVDGEPGSDDTVFSKAVFDTNGVDTVDKKTFSTVSLISKKYQNSSIGTVEWIDGPGQTSDFCFAVNKTDGNGWETVRIIPNGDGTVSFKDSCYDKYITVDEQNRLACNSNLSKEELTANEKFIIHAQAAAPNKVTNFAVSEVAQTSMTLTWSNPASFCTDIEIFQKKDGEGEWTSVAKAGGESYTVTNLEPGTTYYFCAKALFNNGAETAASDFCDETVGKTNLGAKPETPKNVQLAQLEDGKLQLTWDKAENAVSYQILHAVSRFGTYEAVVNEAASAEAVLSADADTSAIVTYDTNDKYRNYYRIVAVNAEGEPSEQSEAVSLEMEFFGDHTLIFAPEDDVQEIDRILLELFEKQNDYDNDAQFNGEQWQVYFKPGDYTETSCMYLGFYTSFNGLGKTPYEVKLNNISIPAYLPNGALGAGENNATCNFWRSTENLSVIDTGNAQGKSGFGSYRPDQFNWAVAQAAPLRRVYSTRPVAYDWNYGWASGGYVADCYFNATFEDNGNLLSAGTFPGQQFFTRNTKLKGDFFGCTLNNFFMGVEAANNLNDQTGEALLGGNGYTNWGKGAPAGENGISGQQIVTDITSTPKISEKPFLYLNEGEYMVFVPGIRTNARGISWSEDNMGTGTSIPLSDFYIAFPTDSAAKINAQIAAGKNIYFTPGQYHVEVPIEVNREDAVLLGTGMASIIPDNGEMAMKVADLDGIRIAGLIFDAGASSKYLLQVGDKGKHTDHSGNPIILQDLFFRVGGTTDKLTKADDALEINSDDVIGDHFWIWRADHGAGVEWYGNESKHGLIVNGDNVNCYALFNEHFQEYHTLWNGENGATYFYQNETCYDPISQEAWMSHNNETQGYSSYKVSNDVKKHYAVGLGVYNVFIYTGPSYNATGVGIELENAIEVPNAPGVIVENACTQTFANAGDMIQKINHVINGVGGSVSSGVNPITGEQGCGWSRKYVVYYNDGNAKVGKWDDSIEAHKGAFLGTEVIENIPQTSDEVISVDRIETLYNEYSKLKKSNYTAKSWENANLAAALSAAKDMIAVGKSKMQQKDLSQSEISEIQSEINKVCTKLEAAYEKLVEVGRGQALYDANKNIRKEDCTVGEWAIFSMTMQMLKAALDAIDTANPTNKQEIYALQADSDTACDRLETILEIVKDLKKASDGSLKKEDYTTKSWNTYRQVIDAAKRAIANPNSSMDELNAVVMKLMDAKLMLEMQKPGSTGMGGAIGGSGGGSGSFGGGSTGSVSTPKQDNAVELQKDGTLKLTGADGKAIVNKLVTMEDGTMYYATKNGTAAMNQIVKVKGKKYYAKDDGIIAIDEICKTTKGSKVYAGKNGVLAANKVITVEGLKYYVKADSTIAKNGFYKTAKGTKVYAKASGALVTGKVFTKNKKMYYADKNGTIVTKKWVKVGSKKYYCSASGKITKTVKVSQ